MSPSGRAPSSLLIAAASAACTGASPPMGSETTTGQVGTTSTTTGIAEVSTGASSGGDASDASTTESMPPSDLPLPPEPKSCSLETIDPDADPSLVIDAGDGVGQIPTPVGEALLRNCGCHYNTNVLMPGSGYIDYLSDKQPMSTWAEFHGNFMGTFPVGFEAMPAYLAIEQRVVFSMPLPMPPFGCGTPGKPGHIGAADLALLTDWLAAQAPDGASYP